MATMAKPRKPSKSAPWPDKLKYLREAWGDGATPLTQEAAAEKFGVSTRTWAGWELGTHTPPVPSGKLIDLYVANPNLQ
mgnify:CR=1 FL=1